MKRADMKTWGIKDEPLANAEGDTLNLSEHAEILADFVRRCDTPMTIGLQGDWGTGKTSMINLMRQNLESEDRYRCVLFNTWQYSQFNLDDQLAISLISDLIDTVSRYNTETASEEKRAVEATVRSLARFAVITANVAATVYSGAEIDIAKVARGEPKEPEAPLRPAQLLSGLKTSVQSLVDDAIESETSGVERFVVFIDDLDRLIPAKAVELLEALKLFLDVRGCVFVLACDYQVVSRGIRDKFGQQEQELEGRSFFDKIIQVPYNMPVHKYDSTRYLTALLERIGDPCDSGDERIEMFRQLIDHSVGLNPRSCKRLLNSYLLLRLVSEKEQLFAGLDVQGVPLSEEQKSKHLLATLCLQMGFERAFREMCRSAIDAEWFAGIDQVIDLAKLVPKYAAREKEAERFRRFLRVFRSAVKFEVSEDGFSESEAAVLEKVLNSSKVTVVSDVDVGAGDDEKVPGYVRRFFAALIDPELEMHQHEGIEYSKEAKTAYYETYLYCDENGEYYLYLRLDVSVRRCNLGIWGCGASQSFRRVRDHLVNGDPDHWCASVGSGGRTLQKEVTYSGVEGCEFRVDELTSSPKAVAEPLKAQVTEAFDALRAAVEEVCG